MSAVHTVSERQPSVARAQDIKPTVSPDVPAEIVQGPPVLCARSKRVHTSTQEDAPLGMAFAFVLGSFNFSASIFSGGDDLRHAEAFCDKCGRPTSITMRSRKSGPVQSTVQIACACGNKIRVSDGIAVTAFYVADKMMKAEGSVAFARRTVEQLTGIRTGAELAVARSNGRLKELKGHGLMPKHHREISLYIGIARAVDTYLSQHPEKEKERTPATLHAVVDIYNRNLAEESRIARPEAAEAGDAELREAEAPQPHPSTDDSSQYLRTFIAVSDAGHEFEIHVHQRVIEMSKPLEAGTVESSVVMSTDKAGAFCVNRIDKGIYDIDSAFGHIRVTSNDPDAP